MFMATILSKKKTSFSLVLLLIISPVFASEHTGFLKRHYISGKNRICVYNVLGDEYILTIKNTEYCKLTIKVNQDKKDERRHN
jgi:hypothetical protein